jgi:anti-sigma B factor antagonist
MALQISEKQINGVTVLDFVGRITLGDESNQVRTRIKEMLGKGKSQIVLDLAGVSYIDSAGLGMLMAGYASARNQGATLKLANLTNKFRELLNITKLVTIFDTFDSVDAAVKSFATKA